MPFIRQLGGNHYRESPRGLPCVQVLLLGETIRGSTLTVKKRNLFLDLRIPASSCSHRLLPPLQVLYSIRLFESPHSQLVVGFDFSSWSTPNSLGVLALWVAPLPAHYGSRFPELSHFELVVGLGSLSHLTLDSLWVLSAGLYPYQYELRDEHL